MSSGYELGAAAASAALAAAGGGGYNVGFSYEEGGFEDAAYGAPVAGSYFALPADGPELIVDESAAMGEGQGGHPQWGRNAGSGASRGGGGGGGGGVGTDSAASASSRSIFEELNVLPPENISLPPPGVPTLFQVPLAYFRSRPWDEVNADKDQFFNYGLDQKSFSEYAARQMRVYNELKEIAAVRERAGVTTLQAAHAAHAQGAGGDNSVRERR